MDFILGKCPGSASMILALLRNLPEGSRFAAVMSAPDDEQEKQPAPRDAEAEAVADRHFWTGDRQLQAQLINAINNLTRYTVALKGGEPPDYPIIGPAAWQSSGISRSSQQQQPAKAVSVDDVFNRMMGR